MTKKKSPSKNRSNAQTTNSTPIVHINSPYLNNTNAVPYILQMAGVNNKSSVPTAIQMAGASKKTTPVGTGPTPTKVVPVPITKGMKTSLIQYKGEVVNVFCCRYLYVGTLVDVNYTEGFIVIADAHVVYEVGKFKDPNGDPDQVYSQMHCMMLPEDGTLHIAIGAVESFGKFQKDSYVEDNK